MKERWIAITLVVAVGLLSSCKTVHQVLSDSQFDASLAETELARERSGNTYPFTLNCEYDYGCPVIRYPINGKEGLFLVDTGAPYCGLYDPGLEKIDTTPDQLNAAFLSGYAEYLQQTNPKLYEKIHDDDDKLLAQMKKDQDKGLNIYCEYDGDEDFSCFWYGQNHDYKLDGCIGLELLRKHNRVTFDFIHNLLILDDEKLDGTATPMAFDTNGDCCIEFLYKGQKEVGIIDTGNYSFSPRNNFGKDDDIYDLNSDYVTADVYQKKNPKKLPFVHTFDDIEICGQRKDGIKGVYSNCWFSTYSVAAQVYLSRVNGIGCELFKGNIIQLDFIDMEFIVK
ncbi:MAG: hypothetical protein KBT02_13605 [Treponema sp.]|nr:hypothetical protein [Candidatus Treponema caballi]